MNNCLEAFTMGNLKNKDVHGQELCSQVPLGHDEDNDSPTESNNEEEADDDDDDDDND